MRGFPLLSTVIVIVLLALARGPLYRSIAVGDSLKHAESEEISDTEMLADSETSVQTMVKIVATDEIVEVRVEHLGKVIIEKSGGSSFEEALPGLPVPSEGIEFWVEAKFAKKNQKVALSIESETDTGDVWKRTLWGEDGVIADAVFLGSR